MATFQSNIFQVFDDLITQHRFIPVKSGAVARFASLIRRETEDVFVYVFVSDGRPGGASLDVNVWIAPPDNADDETECQRKDELNPQKLLEGRVARFFLSPR